MSRPWIYEFPFGKKSKPIVQAGAERNTVVWRMRREKTPASVSVSKNGPAAANWIQDLSHMSATRDELHTLIDRLPESEIPAAQRFLQFLSIEPIGPEFAESIRRGRAQADTGDSIACHNYRGMAASILGDDPS
jgi:hypothetical protein